MNNKKILNAKSNELDNIKFRSLLERRCYQLLKESNLLFEYEPNSFNLFEGIRLQNITIYEPEKKNKGSCDLKKKENLKLRNMTYTPDFVINKNNYTIFVDVKGKENDTYPIKKKLFLALQDSENHIFFEPHSIKQINQMIKIIEEL